MVRFRILALMLAGVCGSVAMATELVGVSGSTTQYTTPIEIDAGGKRATLKLTGTALRKKLIINVYSIGSYLQEGVSVRTAEELAAADGVKRLHLIMERDVSGKDMAEAFRSAIRQNYPAPQFAEEIDAMTQCIQSQDVRKGDEVFLTHVPGVGLQINLTGKSESLIRNPRFSQAVWDFYLGKNNLGAGIKQALVGRL